MGWDFQFELGLTKNRGKPDEEKKSVSLEIVDVYDLKTAYARMHEYVAKSFAGWLLTSCWSSRFNHVSKPYVHKASW